MLALFDLLFLLRDHTPRRVVVEHVGDVLLGDGILLALKLKDALGELRAPPFRILNTRTHVFRNGDLEHGRELGLDSMLRDEPVELRVYGRLGEVLSLAGTAMIMGVAFRASLRPAPHEPIATRAQQKSTQGKVLALHAVLGLLVVATFEDCLHALKTLNGNKRSKCTRPIFAERANHALINGVTEDLPELAHADGFANLATEPVAFENVCGLLRRVTVVHEFERLTNVRRA